MDNRDDIQLIEDYLKGDEKSFEILVQRYLKPIYIFAYHYAGNAKESEDIAQNVFIRVWRNLKKFDSQKSFKNWIFSIAKNASLDFLKKKKAIQFSDLPARGGSALSRENEEWENKFVDSSPLPSEILERKDLIGTLAKATNKLLPKYRKVLFLRHNENLTFREIAETTGEPLNTVKSRYRRGLLILKKIFFF